MNTVMVDTLARALLYEGYILYPYRPSVKNHQRWNFGGVYPPSWSQAQEDADPCVMQTQVLLEAGPSAKLQIQVRFLHLMDRTIGRLEKPLDKLPAGGEPESQLVPSLAVGQKQYQAWQEAVERRIDLGEIEISQLLAGPRQTAFSFPAQRTIEPLRESQSPLPVLGERVRVRDNSSANEEAPDAIGGLFSPSPGTPGEGWGGGQSPINSTPTLALPRSTARLSSPKSGGGNQSSPPIVSRTRDEDLSPRIQGEGEKSAGSIVAILIRQQQKVEGTIEVSAAALAENVIRLSVRIANQTELPDAKNSSRDNALMRTLASTHTILGIENGQFLSMTDPPERRREYARQCVNIGAWPVLVGAVPDGSTMLSSPIIVEDYPKIDPQSPGDLFDATEIDEILTLRIMTLTDEEKRQAAGVDDRVRQLMERTESLAREELMGLHGTLREVVPPRETPADAGFKSGDRVRLRPLGRADVMDIALDGKAATIVSIERDFEDRVYVSVTVDDDPGRDLGLSGQPGHRFFFGIEEVEPLEAKEASV